ncbi:MAG: beta-galactosidase [Armatimonadetes bacterium]|nr:beta-galactosidase [Armatimonadota bacterium]
MDDFAQQFLDPPRQYRPVPFWFLNHRLEEDRLRWQIREMATKGVGGVVLHARHGLQTPYMSDEWMRAIEICVEELGRHGMEAWLYDEDNWPSGTYGGKLTRENPQFRMRYLRVQSLRVAGGVTFQTTLQPDDNTLLCIQAVRIADEGSLAFQGDVRDITERYQDGRLRWEAPPGSWLVALFWECPVAAKVTFANGYYLDTMNEEAVEAFRRLAYDPYDRLSAEFGQTIKGVFTDEPGLMIHDGFFKTQAMRTTVQDLQRVLPGVVLAWTRDFETKFRAMHGYDLRPHLLGLVYDVGPDTGKLRADYFRAIGTWYVESYHGKLSLWCHERGLEYIGHTLEEPLFKQVRTQGNQTWVLTTMDRPGLDYLGHGVGTRDNPFRILSGKCAASVAHTQGKPRVMCEAFGGSGHGHTLLDRRLDANFMAALGVNMFIPHAFYYSFEGFRKTDWPPTEFYHQPYWEFYKEFADYLGRLSLVQSLGHHVSVAAVLSPNKTMYADMFRQGQANETPECQQLMEQVSEALLSLHYDYDFIDDTQLPLAEVRDGELAFPGSEETYMVVVLPGARVMSLAAATRLREFHEAGGSIIALGELPSEADERGQDEALRSIIAGIFTERDGQASTNPAGGHALHSRPKRVQEWLERHLPEVAAADVTIRNAEGRNLDSIICCHRSSAVGESYLLVNRTKEPQSCVFACPVQGRVQEWSLETGESAPVVTRVNDEDWLEVELEFEEAEARLLIITPGAMPEEIAELPTPTVLDNLPLQPTWGFEAVGGNVAILDRWEFTARDIEAGNALHVPEKVNTYRTVFQTAGRLDDVRLVLDDIEQWIPSHVGFLSGIRSLEVFVNGQQVPPLEPSRWQDPDYLWVQIGPYLEPGSNLIEIATISLLNPMHGLREPVYLVGAFAVDEAGVLAPERGKMRGLHTDHGYAHFAGIARYRQTVDIPARLLGDTRVVLDPGEVLGCLRVIVNGKVVGTRIWPPYEVDITSAARAGSNEIVLEVAGTVGNLYSKETVPTGICGQAVIWVLG